MTFAQSVHNKPCSGGGIKAGERARTGRKKKERAENSSLRAWLWKKLQRRRGRRRRQKRKKHRPQWPLLHSFLHQLREKSVCVRLSVTKSERKKMLAHHFEGQRERRYEKGERKKQKREVNDVDVEEDEGEKKTLLFFTKSLSLLARARAPASLQSILHHSIRVTSRLSHAPQLRSSARDQEQRDDAVGDDGEGASSCHCCCRSSDLFFSSFLDPTASPSARRRLDQPGRRAQGLAPPVPRGDPRCELDGVFPGREGEERGFLFLSFFLLLSLVSFSFGVLISFLFFPPSFSLPKTRDATRPRPRPAWATRRRWSAASATTRRGRACGPRSRAPGSRRAASLSAHVQTRQQQQQRAKRAARNSDHRRRRGPPSSCSSPTGKTRS